jgi:chromosome segregation ATPase
MTPQRLTEEEVHAACAEIAAQGERPTALTLLERLGRGSLTTITKYLNSWHTTDKAQAIKTEALPTAVKLPPELSKDGENLIKKIWASAKGIADEELNIQRDALKQAEIANQAKVEEAYRFSEAQALKNERLEDIISDIKVQLAEEQSGHTQTVTKLNEAEKANVGLSKDNDRFQHEISELKKQVATLEESNKTAAQEKQELQQKHDAAFKQKNAEIRSLDMQVHKLQSSLDATVKANEQLKAEIKEKTAELSGRIIQIEKLNVSYKSVVSELETIKSELKDKTATLADLLIALEKLTVRYESVASELKTVKAELKVVNKAATDAGKLVANLEGQLEVYKSIDKEAPK